MSDASAACLAPSTPAFLTTALLTPAPLVVLLTVLLERLEGCWWWWW